MPLHPFQRLLLAACVVGAVSGCCASHHVRDPEYADLMYAVQEAWHSAGAAESAVNPVVERLEGPHAVEDYIRFALDQNPDIQAARKRVEARAYQVPVAGSLQDPMLGMTLFPGPVQTAAGQQEFLLSASQKLPAVGKLSTRAGLVEAETNVARAQLAAVELATVEKVKRAYYELYFVQQAIRVTEADQRLLAQFREIAVRRYEANQTSQQDVLRADLEVSNVENELIRLRQRLESGQARLARVLHVSPQTRLLAMDELPQQQLPADLERLQQVAVSARPELHAQLAALQRDRRGVELARLDYHPDVTLGVTWIDVANSGISPVSNGRDAFLLGVGVNMPIYHERLDSAVRSAEAQAVSTARQYDSLRDATLEEVVDLFAQAQSQQDLLRLFREDILQKARQTVQVSSGAYNAGEVDFLQLIDNWRELLRYEISYHRLEASLRQTLASLERAVGGDTGPPAPEEAPLPPEPLPQLPPPEDEAAHHLPQEALSDNGQAQQPALGEP